MELDAVTNAIATIWSPLQRPYGFGMPGMFEMRDKDAQLGTACGQHNDEFLIPLFFPGEPIGHLVLAVARKVMPKTSTSSSRGIYIKRERTAEDPDTLPEVEYAPRVSLRIWDSRAGTVSQEETQDAAKAVVTYSGWLGQDIDRRVWDATPVFDPGPPSGEAAPSQGRRSRPCGLYVIFKAWALMLGIETTASKRLPIPRGRTLAQFHDYGVKIVNCALRGYMDTRTIRAFFAAFGYSVSQSMEELLEMDNVQAVEMNDEILNNEMVMDQLANQKSTEKADAAHRKKGGGYI